MRTLLLCLSLLAPCSSLLAAESPRVVFRVLFAQDGAVADVALTLVSRDAEGFSSSRPLRASELPEAQRAQFAALQAALTAAANDGGWRLTSGELAQTGATLDFTEGTDTEGNPVRVAVLGTERPVLTLWMTQERDARQRNSTQTSEQWPAEVRAAVLALWQWVQSVP